MAMERVFLSKIVQLVELGRETLPLQEPKFNLLIISKLQVSQILFNISRSNTRILILFIATGTKCAKFVTGKYFATC
jgi:hypothetical protein